MTININDEKKICKYGCLEYCHKTCAEFVANYPELFDPYKITKINCSVLPVTEEQIKKAILYLKGI